MPWDEAFNRSLKLSGSDEGFYLSLKVSPVSYYIINTSLSETLSVSLTRFTL